MSKKWIDAAVAGIAGREQQSRERMGAAANARAEYGEVGLKFWAELVSSIEAGVSEFNSHYPDNLARQVGLDRDDMTYRVRLQNSQFPKVSVSLAYNGITTGIELLTVKTLDVFRHPEQPECATFSFGSFGGKPLILYCSSANFSAQGSPEEVSEGILTKLFQEIV